MPGTLAACRDDEGGGVLGGFAGHLGQHGGIGVGSQHDAIVSPHPYDLEPVEPVIEFQQAKYRFADPVDALAGIDSRPDLLKMDWYRFENLIRQLFEAMGMEVHVTQSSRDEGIDAVAYNETDIVHRAEILIQAKRYSKCVPTNDVRALAGSAEEKRATAGVLVTTAWVSPETKAFAAATTGYESSKAASSSTSRPSTWPWTSASTSPADPDARPKPPPDLTTQAPRRYERVAA